MPDDESRELLKAAAEGATGGAISALVEPVAGFLGKLLGGTAEQIGGWSEDMVVFRRWKARVRMLKRAEQFLEDEGLTAHEVPLPVLLPMLEAGASEEDDSMAERWAALLANAAAEPARVPPSFPLILQQLSPQDAALLDAICGDVRSHEDSEQSHWTAVIGLDVSISQEQRSLSVDNLIRLGLCMPQRPTTLGTIAENRQVLYLTDQGRAFIKECTAPGVDPLSG